MATSSASSASRSDLRAGDGAPPVSRSAARILDLLDLFLSAEGGLSLTEISRRLGMPKSTAHGFLQTMCARGYATCDRATKLYSVGLRLVALANAAPIMQTVQVHARPHLERLARDLEETALLHAYESNGIVAIDVVEAPRSLRYFVRLGHRWPFHSTSAGKLYLAQLDPGAVRALLEAEGMERFTKHTILDIDELLAELEQVRRDGWAAQREEIIDDVSGFGAPVRSFDGRLVAALTVTGPSERITAVQDRIVEALLTESRALSAELSRLG
jgi:DNA-binding IclR family transcriptional regulator